MSAQPGRATRHPSQCVTPLLYFQKKIPGKLKGQAHVAPTLAQVAFPILAQPKLSRMTLVLFFCPAQPPLQKAGLAQTKP